MKWILFIPAFFWLGSAVAAPHTTDEDAEFDRATLQGATESSAGEDVVPTLNVKARFDAAFSGGEPTQQGFTLPHFFLGVDGTANPWMTYRLTVSPSREYSTGLVPNVVPTEAFIRMGSVSQKEMADTANITATLGLMAPTINPWWSPDIGDLWVPDFFYGQRLLLLSRDMGLELAGHLIPKRLEVAVGYFNGNGIFGFNTNNSRALTAFGRLHLIPPGTWQMYVGGGFFHFAQGVSGATNYRQNWVANPFLAIEGEPLQLHFSLEGWWGGFQDSARRYSPKGVVASLRLGHPRLQGFVRYLNLSSVPTSMGRLSELHLGATSDPFPHLKIFFYFQQVAGRSTGTENSVNLRARFAL